MPKGMAQVQGGTHAALLLVCRHNLRLVYARPLDGICEGLRGGCNTMLMMRYFSGSCDAANMATPGHATQWQAAHTAGSCRDCKPHAARKFGEGSSLPQPWHTCSVCMQARCCYTSGRTSGSRCNRRSMFCSSHSNSGASRINPYLMISACGYHQHVSAGTSEPDGLGDVQQGIER